MTEWILKKPYDPKWKKILDEHNKTPLLIEYKTQEKIGKLFKRIRKSINSEWSSWYKICKHGRSIYNCKCGIKVKKTPNMTIDSNLSFSKQKRKKKKYIQGYYNKESTIIKYQKRKEKISLLNYTDIKYKSPTCSICKKIKVEVENMYTHTLLLNETYACTDANHNDKKLRWKSKCVECYSNTSKLNYATGGYVFVSNQIGRIRNHININISEAKLYFNNLCEIDQNRCYTCNVELIKNGKSGFAQLSINKLHPNLTESTILHLSCLACNLCQNNLPYRDFLKNLLAIVFNNNSGVVKNNNVLTTTELKWLKNGNYGNVCHPNIRLDVVKKYGRYCRYTGLEVIFGPHKFNTASFDRINSKLPYSAEQTQLVCKHINYVKKGTIDESELFKWLDHLKCNKVFIYNRFVSFI